MEWLSLSNVIKTVVEHDGKRWNRTELPSGAVIESEIVEKTIKYRYEAYTKEIIHPKLRAPIYRDYEVLEFKEELTPTEIGNLEAELEKTIIEIE